MAIKFEDLPNPVKVGIARFLDKMEEKGSKLVICPRCEGQCSLGRCEGNTQTELDEWVCWMCGYRIIFVSRRDWCE